MNAWRFDRDSRGTLGHSAVIAGCLLLASCTTSAPTSGWVKAGVDDATASHEVGNCQAQANAALANEQGINQDINATLGRNWQLGRTTPVVDQSMRQEATDYADQVFTSCMSAKGFRKAG
jgi:hypothetical protein